MSLVAVTCAACGGAVAMAAGASVPACLFCGASQPVPSASPEGIELPELVLPFRTDRAAAQRIFRAWARRQLWAPGELQQARVALHAVLLPAWAWSAHADVRYAAIVPDPSTLSDHRPDSGRHQQRLDGVLVPASATLPRHELRAIEPFRMDEARRFAVDDLSVPFELGRLTRSAARKRATERMERRLAAQLKRALGAKKLRVSTRFGAVEGASLYLPVWIGAYRLHDVAHRVVINGQTGVLASKAPLSWWKVAAAVLVLLVVVVLLGALLLRP